MQWLADFIAGNDWLANRTDAYVLAVFPLLQDYSDTPFLAATDWGAVVQIYLTLTIAFLISLGMAVFLLWRTQIHRVLRVGEE